jgi:hypothetical protein
MVLRPCALECASKRIGTLHACASRIDCWLAWVPLRCPPGRCYEGAKTVRALTGLQAPDAALAAASPDVRSPNVGPLHLPLTQI